MSFNVSNPALARALERKGYTEPTQVQQAILDAESEQDLLVSAQTGSGKTIAYGLAVAETLIGTAEAFEPAGLPQALIVAPTRELALQVQRELQWLYAETGARVVTCVGGMDIRTEHRNLDRGAHIVVGTPGRLRDHLERNRLDISEIRAVVLDEADEMLNLGFREDLEFILKATPTERRTLLFSATIARDIATLAKSYQRKALRIDVSAQNSGHDDIEFRAIRIAPRDVEHAVVNVLRFYEAPGALVFCSTREAVRRLQSNLLERGFSVVSLSGELSQKERTEAMQAMRNGSARVCVATDVAARGIDLPGLQLVIHAELPKQKETLQHRSGRTGRAGQKGTCILLVPQNRRRMAERLLSDSGIAATWDNAPNAEQIRQLDRDRLRAQLILQLAAQQENEESEADIAMARSLIEERSAEEIALALIRMHAARLPAPEDLIDQPDTADGKQRGADGGKWGEGPVGDMIWYKIAIGRNQQADLRWLLPMICRRGHVTKKDIGHIRIFEQDTWFQIDTAVASKFAAAAAKSGRERDDAAIDQCDGEPPARGSGGADRKRFGAKDGFKKDYAEGKPKRFAPRDGDDRPAKPFAGKKSSSYGDPKPKRFGADGDDKAAASDGYATRHKRDFASKDEAGFGFKKNKPNAGKPKPPPGARPAAKRKKSRAERKAD